MASASRSDPLATRRHSDEKGTAGLCSATSRRAAPEADARLAHKGAAIRAHVAEPGRAPRAGTRGRECVARCCQLATSRGGRGAAGAALFARRARAAARVVLERLVGRCWAGLASRGRPRSGARVGRPPASKRGGTGVACVTETRLVFDLPRFELGTRNLHGTAVRAGDWCARVICKRVTLS